jgi:hypothetical protein
MHRAPTYSLHRNSRLKTQNSNNVRARWRCALEPRLSGCESEAGRCLSFAF